MDLLSSIFSCAFPHLDRDPAEEQRADDIVHRLFTTEKHGHELRNELTEKARAAGFKDRLAVLVWEKVHKLVTTRNPQSLPDGLQRVYEAVQQIAKETMGFERDHPIICTLIVIAVLLFMAPWVLEVLGFGEFGPVAGSFAARWMRWYGLVPRGSWYSFFQRLGMIWRH